VVVKVWDGEKRGEDKFLKYHVRNLIKFVQFLDEKHSGWKWFNVYAKSGEQLASYTVNNRPQYPRV